MKTEKRILAAFVLNLAFSVFEFVGGAVTGSVAIASDAIHDIGDAASIGISYFLERKSKKEPDTTHTYGYARYSVIGGVITALILLIGSLTVAFGAVLRIVDPVAIDYDGMILFALIGVCVNLCAARFTSEGGSINQRAVNLHMLEDVLGWAVVLVGAVVMRFTNAYYIDPIMSVGVAVFIAIGAVRCLRESLDVFLEKAPEGVDCEQIKHHVLEIEGVVDVHHLHVWSIDGERCFATMHIVTDAEPKKVKEKVREELGEHGVCHATLELESTDEDCREHKCEVKLQENSGHSHHHHHHH